MDDKDYITFVSDEISKSCGNDMLKFLTKKIGSAAAMEHVRDGQYTGRQPFLRGLGKFPLTILHSQAEVIGGLLCEPCHPEQLIELRQGGADLIFQSLRRVLCG